MCLDGTNFTLLFLCALSQESDQHALLIHSTGKTSKIKDLGVISKHATNPIYYILVSNCHVKISLYSKVRLFHTFFRDIFLIGDGYVFMSTSQNACHNQTSDKSVSQTGHSLGFPFS